MFKTTPVKNKVEREKEKIAKKQKINNGDNSSANSATPTYSNKNVKSLWLNQKTFLVPNVKVHDNVEVLDLCEDDENSNDAFAEVLKLAADFDAQSSASDGDLNNGDQSIKLVYQPVQPAFPAEDVTVDLFESHPCVRVFPFATEGYEWTASAASDQDLVTFTRTMSNGKRIETSYIPLTIKADAVPMPAWIGCVAFRDTNEDNTCNGEAVGLSACCAGNDVYCLNHMPHWVHTMCMEDEAQYLENQRRANEYAQDLELEEEHQLSESEDEEEACECWCKKCSCIKL